MHMDVNSKVSVIGSSGLIGSSLCRALKEKNYAVKGFARTIEKLSADEVDEKEQYIFGDQKLHEKLNGSMAIFNFSGAPAFKKWKGDYRNEIVSSRVNVTKHICEEIAKMDPLPDVFVNGTASGIYGYDSWNDSEVSEEYPAGTDFWGRLVTSWEQATKDLEGKGVRVVNIRTSVVLSDKGGALPELVKVFRKGLGGPISPGNQWFPWIHIQDEVALAIFCMENRGVEGPVNASSPNVPTMREFATTLGKVLQKSSRLKIPVFMLRLAIGESANALANGRKVIPKKALECGYKFQFTDLEEALNNLLSGK